MRSTPKRMRNNPASNVHIISPPMPKRGSDTMPAIMITNAPVGPPIWYLLPPISDIMKPATIAVISPVDGVMAGHPQAMANAMAKGRATTPTVRPAVRSERNVFLLYSFSVLNRLGVYISNLQYTPVYLPCKVKICICGIKLAPLSRFVAVLWRLRGTPFGARGVGGICFFVNYLLVTAGGM